MYSTYPPQATSGLSEYQAINTVLFITLIVITLIALISIIRFSKLKPSSQAEPFKARFIELEKDFGWRRLKVAYLIGSAIVILSVIGISYGTDVRAPLQTIYDFEVERAEDRMGTAFTAIITTLLLWAGYFLLLPLIFQAISKTKKYLRKPNVR